MLINPGTVFAFTLVFCSNWLASLALANSTLKLVVLVRIELFRESVLIICLLRFTDTVTDHQSICIHAIHIAMQTNIGLTV